MKISKIVLMVVAMFSLTANANTKFTVNDKDAAEYCKNLDVNKIEKLKSLATTSAIGGVVGAASGASGVATSLISGSKLSDEKGKKGLDIATTIPSGLGATAGIMSVSTSGAGLAEIEGIFDTINKCKEKMSKI